MEVLMQHNFETLKSMFDWSDETILQIADIFYKYQSMIINEENPNLDTLETEIKNLLDIDYHDFKSVILAFWENGQFQDVCLAFKAIHPTRELQRIQ